MDEKQSSKKSFLVYYWFFYFCSKVVKTEVADASCLSIKVTALVVMFHGCLKTARNHVIGVQLVDSKHV